MTRQETSNKTEINEVERKIIELVARLVLLLASSKQVNSISFELESGEEVVVGNQENNGTIIWSWLRQVEYSRGVFAKIHILRAVDWPEASMILVFNYILEKIGLKLKS